MEPNELKQTIEKTITFRGYRTSDYTGACFAVAPEDYEEIMDLKPEIYDFSGTHKGMVTLYMSQLMSKLTSPQDDNLEPTVYEFKITMEATPIKGIA